MSLIQNSAAALEVRVAHAGWTTSNCAEASSLAAALIDVYGTGGYAIHRWERWTNPRGEAIAWAVTPYRR